MGNGSISTPRTPVTQPSPSSPPWIHGLAGFILTALSLSSVGVSLQDDAVAIFPLVFDPWIEPGL